MLEVYEKTTHAETATEELCLAYDQRKRGRLKAHTASGLDIGLFLERGEALRDGQLLRSKCGVIIAVRAADEEVATATSEDSLLFARACYHLGNRHVPLQIDHRQLRFQRDPVLEQLARQLGMTVMCETAPFHPESGAYSGHGHHEHKSDG